ncbi:MAG TPA: hypothetical protein VGG12_04865 [Methylovirgula sp.]
MTQRMHEIATEIVRLQSELDGEIEKKRKALGWRIRDDLVEFEHGIVEEHRRFRKNLRHFLAESPFYTTLSAPVIYSLIVPFALMDLWVSVYQTICFRVYRIPLVRRANYVVIDRQHLAYLNHIEALNCIFCGYANGVIAYVREVASRTEQYWCPIKHALRVSNPHERYWQFLDYGDASGYRARLESFREKLRTLPDEGEVKA